jgi:type II secretory pathway component PulJ
MKNSGVILTIAVLACMSVPLLFVMRSVSRRADSVRRFSLKDGEIQDAAFFMTRDNRAALPMHDHAAEKPRNPF